MKKFGKLRQWTDEKLGAGQKTMATEQFKELESEINTRNQGLESIHAACSVWMRSLAKKKEGADKEKGVPVELFGIALFQHGEEFAKDSAYGQALMKIGITEQKIGRAQEAFQNKISETVLTSMERSLAQMKEFQNARKKLESRRLTYDSALSKCQKAKKEDSRTEEELRLAKVRYEEIQGDVENRMICIRDAEANNLNDIGQLIEAQYDYYRSELDLATELREAFRREIGMRDYSRERKVKNNSNDDDNRMTSSVQIATPPMSAVQEVTDPYVLQEHTDVFGISEARRSLRSISNMTRSPSSSSEDTISRGSALKLACRDAQASTKNNKRVVASFSFDAEGENELSIRPKDIIDVLREVSEGWWLGRVVTEDGTAISKSGLFPANYCKPYTPARTSLMLPIICTATSLEDYREQDYGRSRTFPRTTRQPVSTGANRNASVTNLPVSQKTRPPPPPIPKKKSSSSTSPQRIPS